jgi:hypothetical protein
MSESAPPPGSENQSQRWVKYGANVALTIVLVVVIAGLLTYIAQAHPRRLDTTSNGVFSLKPQTLNVIDNLKDKITLVSLYTKTQPDTRGQDETDATATATNPDAAQTVADLLDEYRRDGKNIDVEIIDPVTEKDKLAKLHEQLVADYGGQIQSYKEFLDEWDKQYKEFEKLTTAEAAAMTAVTGGAAIDDSDDSSTNASGFRPELIRTIKGLPRSLADMKDEIDQERAKKYPDWKQANSDLKDYLQRLSELSGNLATNFAKLKTDNQIPANVRQYMAESQPRYEQIKQTADDLIAKSGKLGELKIDQLEEALNVNNPVLVLGPTDWRVLQYNQVWPEDTDLKNMVAGKIQPRFAGEQQVTSAIYSLTTNKQPKLCFVRPGGQPVTTAGFPPFIQSGVMSQIAERMRQYNFTIQEKDLSGQWAMQAQMQGMPAAPEPSDEEIKDSIWVVLDMPRSFNNGQQDAPPTPIAPKVKEHLDEGGSALIIFDYQAEDLRSALDDWGIRLHPDTLAVHEPIQLTAGSPPDLVEEFKSHPADWVIKDYGDSVITRPLQSLESIWVPAMCVSTEPAKDATTTPLVPFDKAYGGLKVWGETDVEAIRPDNPPTFDPAKDLGPPIYGMAISEKPSGARVVAMGSPIMFDGRINIPDPTVAQTQHRYVNRFPGNGELAANSIFWLAHLEPMIAISPAAMDVSRIRDISPGLLGFWRYGVLLALLPASIIVAGLFVYAGRRD